MRVELVHLFQQVGFASNKLLFLTVQQNLKSSLDTGLRLDGLPALELRDLIVSVLEACLRFQIEQRDFLMLMLREITNLKGRSM